ncbi:MAG: DUF2933 domain-containing protein [Betaproteobacteria bacterium]|nr:DUF2933 domain-containing protein [Betaproteobacteria bacterium]
METTPGKAPTQGPVGPGNGRGKWIFLAFTAITAFFLFTEHRAHLFGILPYLLLLACPLMHLFHHGGHGARHEGHGDMHTKQKGAKK